MPAKNKGRAKKQQKKQQKNASKKSVTAAAAAPAEAVPVVDSTPVEAVPVVDSTPVEETTPVVVSATQKGGAKKPRKTKKTASKATPVAPAVEEVTEQATELATVTETVTETTTESQTGSGKKVRSFKVRLPGNETFEGRFTGLTPYQAANKALSKYYRETKSPKKQIRFTIRESTRGSKRSTYTYNGQREKLSTPVEYSIKDGRTITKNYKNRLTKVKKAELEALALASTA